MELRQLSRYHCRGKTTGSQDTGRVHKFWVGEASTDTTTGHTSETPAAPVNETDRSDIVAPTVRGPTTSSQERNVWKDEAREVAKQVISAVSKRVGANTWEKRCKELHPAVTKALDSNLNNITAKYNECVL